VPGEANFVLLTDILAMDGSEADAEVIAVIVNDRVM
jgi:hypothetical protein